MFVKWTAPLVASFACAMAITGRADVPSGDVRVEARRLNASGTAAYRAQRYAEALAFFEEAYRTFPAEALLLNLSRTELRLGQCQDALRYARTYAAMAAPDSSPSRELPEEWLKSLEPPGTAAQDEASIDPQTWLVDVNFECPEVELTSEPPGASVVVEGEGWPTSYQTPWKGRLSKGEHSLTAKFGATVRHETLTVVAGTPLHVRISFSEPPQAAPTVVTSTSPVRGESPAILGAPSKSTGHLTPQEPRAVPIPRWSPWVPTGGALAGLLLAISGGALTEQCPRTIATPQDYFDSQLCAAHRATIADVGWGVAGAGAITATVLWVLNWRQGATVPSPVRVDATSNGVRLSALF